MFWKECELLQDELVCNRRALHKIPEVGLILPETQAFVCARLDEYGIPYKKSGTDSSIIAEIKGGQPGKTIALRADMDALPIQEDTGLPFSSEHPGAMHACGHDNHASMLLGAAKVLNEHKAELKGNVRLLFQTAEEQARGSRVMIADGALEGVDAIFGTHIGSIIDKTIPSGKVIICPGPVMASYDRFVIHVHGIGCHGSTPEKGVDPVNIAAHIIVGLETVAAREFNACIPNVITIGMIHGGNQYNVIPNDVDIEGTTRALDEGVRQRMAKRIEEISRHTAEAFGGSVEFEMDWGAAPVINDAEMAHLAQNAAREIVGDEDLITYREFPNMAGEDFAYYLQQVPGAFMFLSSSNPEKHTDVAHHNPKFDVDEDVLWKGSALFVNIVENFLK